MPSLTCKSRQGLWNNGCGSLVANSTIRVRKIIDSFLVQFLGASRIKALPGVVGSI